LLATTGPTGDTLLMLGGENAYDNNNEVWGSIDQGKSWLLMSARAPWMQRNYHSTHVTKDGAIVLLAGLGDKQPGFDTTTQQNDVWLSLDGGFTWGECTQDAAWDDRYLAASTIDANGYLVVAGGRVFEDGAIQRVFNDVWRSTTSFHDINAIAARCNVPVPSCGVGLKCLPGSDTFMSLDGSYVSCAACPAPNMAAEAAASSYMLYGGYVLFVVTLLVLLYTMFSVRSAGGASPLPLFCLDGWWKSGRPTTEAQLLPNTLDGETSSDYQRA